MSATPFTNKTHMTSAQSQKEVTFNAFMDHIEYQLHGQLVHDISVDDNYTLNVGATVDESVYGTIEITDTGTVLTTGRDVVFPAQKRRFYFINSTAQTLTVKCSGQTGVTVATGNEGWLLCNGTDVSKLTPSW